jgi:hypothetical protein
MCSRVSEKPASNSPEKCELFRKEVWYMKHEWTEGVITDPENLKAVRVAATEGQTRVKEFPWFVYLLQEVHTWILWHCKAVDPIHRREMLSGPWKSLRTAPVLGYPRPGGKFIVNTDASNMGIGGVLSQETDGQGRVLVYYSKILSRSERNYCVTRRGYWLQWRRWNTSTNTSMDKISTCAPTTPHWPGSSLKNVEVQTTHWVQRLRYSFTSQHSHGRKHTEVDALSRRPCHGESADFQKGELQASSLKVRVTAATAADGRDRTTLTRKQLDNDVGQIPHEVVAGQRPEWKDIGDRSPI